MAFLRICPKCKGQFQTKRLVPAKCRACGADVPVPKEKKNK